MFNHCLGPRYFIFSLVLNFCLLSMFLGPIYHSPLPTTHFSTTTTHSTPPPPILHLHHPFYTPTTHFTPPPPILHLHHPSYTTTMPFSPHNHYNHYDSSTSSIDSSYGYGYDGTTSKQVLAAVSTTTNSAGCNVTGSCMNTRGIKWHHQHLLRAVM